MSTQPEIQTYTKAIKDTAIEIHEFFLEDGRTLKAVVEELIVRRTARNKTP